MGGMGQNLQLQSDSSEIVCAIGHHTKLAHAKFCDKICHILQVMGKNERARHYKSGFSRLKFPLARLSGLQCHNMGHNGHRINL